MLRMRKRRRKRRRKMNQLCSLGQRLSKCGYMTVFGIDFIEIFTD